MAGCGGALLARPSALRAAARGQRDAILARNLEGLAEDLEGGAPLAESLRRLAPLLGVEAVALLAAGARTGDVERGVAAARDALGRREQTRALAASLLLYPGMVLAGCLGVGALLSSTLLPSMAELARDGGSGSRLFAPALFLSGHPWSLLLPLAPVLAIAVWVRAHPGGRLRRALDRLHLVLPVVGRIERLRAAALVAGPAAGYLRAGTPGPVMLGQIAQGHPNRHVAGTLALHAARAAEGHPLGQLLWLPELMSRSQLLQLVSAARTGELPGALDRLHDALQVAHREATQGARPLAAVAGTLLAAALVCLFLALFFVPLLLWSPEVMP